MTRLLSILFVVGCGGGAKHVEKPLEPKPDPIPTTAGPDCAAVGEHIATVALADKPDMQKGAADAFRTRCAGDKWSDETRSCFATAENASELEGCSGKLTAAQKDALAKAKPNEPAAAMAPPGAPANATKPEPRRTRGAVQKKDKKGDGADPCQGGQADPCQGGQ